VPQAPRGTHLQYLPIPATPFFVLPARCLPHRWPQAGAFAFSVAFQ